MNESKVPEALLNDRVKLIELIHRLIQDIFDATSTMEKGHSSFHAKTIPAMSPFDYLMRLSRYTHCSTSAYVIALIYIDRLQESLQDFVLNKYCIHKVLITSIVLAAKYNDDQYYKNMYYAKVGGIPIEQMNALEIYFSNALDFNFFVRPKQFGNYLEKLAAYDECKQ